MRSVSPGPAAERNRHLTARIASEPARIFLLQIRSEAGISSYRFNFFFIIPTHPPPPPPLLLLLLLLILCVCVGWSQPGILQIGKALARLRHNMKDSIANNSTASISQARKAVEQLKMEACMDRIKVSKAAADLMAYCDAHTREDPLIVPVPASENPFREKKFFCTIL